MQFPDVILIPPAAIEIVAAGGKKFASKLTDSSQFRSSLVRYAGVKNQTSRVSSRGECSEAGSRSVSSVGSRDCFARVTKARGLLYKSFEVEIADREMNVSVGV